MSNITKTPTVYQMEAAECGAASLAMILAYYGKHVPLEKIRIDVGVSRDGSKAGNLIRAAKKYGFEAHGYKKDFEALLQMKPPCILLLKQGHFVVFEGVRGKNAYVNDPAVGRRKFSLKELNEQFGCVVLTFIRSDSFTKESNADSSFSSIVNRVKPYIKSYIFYMLLVAVSVALLFLMIFLIQMFIDKPFEIKNTHYLLMAVLIATEIAMLKLQGVIRGKNNKNIVIFSTKRFVEKVLRLPLNFFEQRYTGDLVSRIDKNSVTDKFIYDSMTDVVLGVIISVVCILIMASYSMFLTLVAVLCLALEFAIIQLILAKTQSLADKLSVENSVFAGKVYAGLSIIETLKASGSDSEYISKLIEQNKKMQEIRKKCDKYRQITGAVAVFIMLVSIIVLVAIGIKITRADKLTYGGLIAFLLVYTVFLNPISTMSSLTEQLNAFKLNISTSEDVLNYESDNIFDDKNKRITHKLEGSVMLDKVNFAYNPLSDDIIKNISMKIETGSIVAIVGKSGCGKSTISKLISGLYKPTCGDVFIDGISLSRIPKRIINASVSIVNQNSNLFSGSIKDNITMWNTKISQSSVIEAAKDACIYDFIMEKREKFDFLVKENGANLSGGQRQRVEIARALAVNPTVIILDEATSALDHLTEKKIIENIKRRGCTCIIVAHRLSAIRDSDNVVVIDDGKIVEQGTHKYLCSKKGVYYNLINSH